MSQEFDKLYNKIQLMFRKRKLCSYIIEKEQTKQKFKLPMRGASIEIII